MSSNQSPPPADEPPTWLSSYTKDEVFNREHDRMRAQHVITRAAMHDRLIYAAFENTAHLPDLYILDSACNDGTWMLDVIANRAAQLQKPPDTKLSFLGTDIDKEHFSGLDLAATLPPNVSIDFQEQDISEPWPEDLGSRFDLVHQRFALQYLGDSDDSAQQAVARMLGLAKPGTGWIELIEANVVEWAEGTSADLIPTLRRAKQMTMDFCAKLSINLRAHERLGRWLRAAGAVDVEVKNFEYIVGGKTELGQKVLRNLLEFLGTQKAVTGDWKGFGHSGEEYDGVIRELEHYFGWEGRESAWDFVAAWGRRPA